MTFSVELKSEFIGMLNRENISYSQGWSNHMNTVTNPAALVVDIEREEQVQQIMKKVQQLNATRSPENKITLRASAGWENKEVGCCLFPWVKVQDKEYGRGSYSFSQVVGGRASPSGEGTDIILRFKKKFHYAKVLGPLDTKPERFNPENPIHQLPATLVEVSAGMQVAEYCEFLRRNNLSTTTISMLSWPSVIGLLGTGGHGTGRDEQAVSGLLESIRVCDLDGSIRELTREDPDFKILTTAHSGYLGVVLSAKMRAVKGFNLRETIALFRDAQEMKGQLGDILQNNHYVSIMGMPSGSSSELSEEIHHWQVRMWNFTLDKPTKKTKPTYAPTTASFFQEAQVRLGEDVMDFMVHSDLNRLMPAFLLLSAAASIDARGTESKVDFENHITHPQVAFPEQLRDVDYFIPVRDEQAGERLEGILEQLELQINEAARRGESPVTYAIYVRYFWGTEQYGLSPTGTIDPEERVLAVDVVTHPEAKGIRRFERHFIEYLREQNILFRNHLGKEFPNGIERYDQFLNPEQIQEFVQAAERWNASPGENDGAERLAMAPFHTKYMQKMLNLRPVLDLQLSAKRYTTKPKKMEYNEVGYVEFITRLITIISLMKVHGKASERAKDAFLTICREELNERERDLVIT